MMIIPNIWKHNPNVPNHQPGMYMSHDKTGTFYQKHVIEYLQNGRMVIAISTNQWKWITPLQLLFWTEWESMSPMFLDILTTDSIPCPTIGWYGSDKPLNGVRSCSWIYKQVLHVNLCKTCLMNVLRDCKSQFHALMYHQQDLKTLILAIAKPKPQLATMLLNLPSCHHTCPWKFPHV